MRKTNEIYQILNAFMKVLIKLLRIALLINKCKPVTHVATNLLLRIILEHINNNCQCLLLFSEFLNILLLRITQVNIQQVLKLDFINK